MVSSFGNTPSLSGTKVGASPANGPSLFFHFSGLFFHVGKKDMTFFIKNLTINYLRNSLGAIPNSCVKVLEK